VDMFALVQVLDKQWGQGWVLEWDQERGQVLVQVWVLKCGQARDQELDQLWGQAWALEWDQVLVLEGGWALEWVLKWDQGLDQ
jgi:hypothetical protein